jgi:hypothetical protein
VTKLTARQKAVIRTGAANVADMYDLKPKGEKRFRRAAKRAIRKPGVSAESRAYRRTIVRADRKETTRAEAKGAAKVLRRADTAVRRPAAPRPKETQISRHKTEVSKNRVRKG